MEMKLAPLGTCNVTNLTHQKTLEVTECFYFKQKPLMRILQFSIQNEALTVKNVLDKRVIKVKLKSTHRRRRILTHQVLLVRVLFCVNNHTKACNFKANNVTADIWK